MKANPQVKAKHLNMLLQQARDLQFEREMLESKKELSPDETIRLLEIPELLRMLEKEFYDVRGD